MSNMSTPLALPTSMEPSSSARYASTEKSIFVRNLNHPELVFDPVSFKFVRTFRKLQDRLKELLSDDDHEGEPLEFVVLIRGGDRIVNNKMWQSFLGRNGKHELDVYVRRSVIEHPPPPLPVPGELVLPVSEVAGSARSVRGVQRSAGSHSGVLVSPTSDGSQPIAPPASGSSLPVSSTNGVVSGSNHRAVASAAPRSLGRSSSPQTTSSLPSDRRDVAGSVCNAPGSNCPSVTSAAPLSLGRSSSSFSTPSDDHWAGAGSSTDPIVLDDANSSSEEIPIGICKANNEGEADEEEEEIWLYVTDCTLGKDLYEEVAQVLDFDERETEEMLLFHGGNLFTKDSVIGAFLVRRYPHFVVRC